MGGWGGGGNPEIFCRHEKNCLQEDDTGKNVFTDNDTEKKLFVLKNFSSPCFQKNNGSPHR